MSTFGVDLYTSRDGSVGSITAATLVQGTAKAWFNLNGTGTITARDDFNVASYVDNGVGDYTCNFATARPNANYSISGAVEPESPNVGLFFPFAGGNSSTLSIPLTSSFRWISANGGMGSVDRGRNVATVHGDPN